MPVVTLKFSGPQSSAADDDACIKTEVADVGLSESTCGNGNSDLYKALLAIINGTPIPTVSIPASLSTTVWAQDQIGNGYTVDIARGSYTITQETTQEAKPLSVNPGMVVDGVIDLEAALGWTLDSIYTVSWAGVVYDEDGNSTAKPLLTKAGGSVRLSPAAGVYGSLLVKYALTRDKITVSNDQDDGAWSYDTSLSFDVDGCDEEETLQLPAQSCINEQLGNPWDDDPFDYFGDDGDATVDEDPPTEGPSDTESVYDYCSRKLKHSDLPDAPEYWNIVPGACDDPGGI